MRWAGPEGLKPPPKENTVNDLEQDVRELRLAEQAILKEALEKKDARIRELETEAVYLRRTLNEALAVPRAAVALAGGAAPARPVRGELPRRWKA